ncbi:Os10g0385550 [Oryza sativa Japonica Group]|uniref:Os10g0385550 protein n=1 Tax=Oryza sativa subsp. japonica TaxID=39947 RepID=C7J7F3_ORYSJ|nr:Os10g0385550 [Oryza sativa Japonica Group]|eukprot:NP_001176134.1 Os10g0385550 [Oryza sativa Japonica Group]
MPNISPFDFILSGAANRRERCHAHRSSGARSAHRRSNIVAVAINLDQAGASHHATSFTSTSSPFPLKNLQEWCYECGDRPPSSPPPVAVAIVDSASSGEPLSDSSRIHHPWDLTNPMKTHACQFDEWIEPLPSSRSSTPSPDHLLLRCRCPDFPAPRSRFDDCLNGEEVI